MANRTNWVFNRVFDVLRHELFLKIQLGKKAGEKGILKCVSIFSIKSAVLSLHYRAADAWQCKCLNGTYPKLFDGSISGIEFTVTNTLCWHFILSFISGTPSVFVRINIDKRVPCFNYYLFYQNRHGKTRFCILNFFFDSPNIYFMPRKASRMVRCRSEILLIWGIYEVLIFCTLVTL